MSKTFVLLALAASTFALSGCLTSSKSGSKPIVAAAAAGPVAPYNFDPVLGAYVDNAAHDIYSVADDQSPINTRFSAQFTAGGELIFVDKDANGGAGQTYTFTQAELQNSFGGLDFMKAYGSQLDNRASIGGGAGWMGDPGFEQVYIVTPTNTNSNEYALMRLGSTDNGTQWLMVGDPTSTALNGVATYTGGAYLSVGHASMIMAANFDNNADAINVTLANAYNPADVAMFGATAISFNADYNAGARTITATGKAVAGAGSNYDTVDMYGAMFNDGAASAGLIRLQDSTLGTPDAAGAYHVVRD